MALSVTILTGQAGSGKSTAVHALEDQGYLCVDNLPVGVAGALLDSLRGAQSLPQSSGGEHPGERQQIDRLALVMDVRVPRPEDIPQWLESLRASGEKVFVVFLEAHQEALRRRFSASRRPHPLDHGQGLQSAMLRELELLAPVRALADLTIDTTSMSPHELKNRILEQVAGVRVGDDLRITLMSFGYKYGIPLEADLVFDMRFLRNPYFVDEMRNLNGLQDNVRDFVINSEEGQLTLEHTQKYLEFVLPKFRSEGKRYLTVAIGCTGGRHRSVAIARALAERLRQSGMIFEVRHRDIHDEHRMQEVQS